jgi:CDP-diacylglycerol---glycerol-3-phosphate 3-phosphatidyltransferase
MTANQVTVLRVGAAFAAVALFTFLGPMIIADFVAVALTVGVIALDGVDGYLARTRNMATPLGAQLDILGDRIIENLFFTFFAVAGLISFWIPVLFFVRGALTDFFRGLGARSGHVGFSMLEATWARKLVASRASRTAYAVLKCACFCCLGLLLPMRQITVDGWIGTVAQTWLPAAAQILEVATVCFCAIRAVPVIWEGRRYFLGNETNSASRVIAGATR